MILTLHLYTEPNLGNIPRAREGLISRGLVPGREPPYTPQSEINNYVLVWEDPEKHIGRYRVHLYENSRNEETEEHEVRDLIRFGYWTNTRSFNQEILRQEPMDLAIRTVLPLLKGKIEIRPDHIDITTVPELVQCMERMDKLAEDSLRRAKSMG